MSAFCVVIKLDNSEVSSNELDRIFDALAHIRSDRESKISTGAIGFIQKRFWITPESKLESQPVVKQGEYTLVGDYRIDNREELLEALDLAGTDQQISDDQLILHGYMQWGRECPKHFVGDFSFAVWDSAAETLFCSRDRIGIKPLYYVRTEKFFACASDMEALFALDGVDRDFDRNSIAQYLSSDWSIARDRTFYTQIYRLPASGYFEFSNHEELEIERYWHPEHIQVDHTMTMEQAVEGFKLHFRTAVKACMRSAYPIAFEVSGGMDSSSVFCVGNNLGFPDGTLSYTIQYKNLKCDESHFVDHLAEKTGVEIMKIDWSQIDFAGTYNNDLIVPYRMNWPAHGTTFEHLYKSELLAKKDVRAVLTGMAGDEVMGGYWRFIQDYVDEGRYLNILRIVQGWPLSRRRKIRYLLSLLLFQPVKKPLKKLISRHTAVEEKHDPGLLLKNVLFEKASELADEFQASLPAYQRSCIEAVMSNYIASWADMNVLGLANRVGVEFRHPFFDARLIEFMMSVPPELKIQNGQYKSILHKAMQRLLPDEILNRAFDTIQSESLISQLTALPPNFAGPGSIFGHLRLIDQDRIKELMGEYENNNLHEDDLMIYWGTMNLNCWLSR